MKAKVAMVCPQFYPSIGGVQNHVRQISERLIKLGIEIDILTTDPQDKLPKHEEMNGMTIKRFRSWAPGNAFYFSPFLRKYLKKHATCYDLVHVHNYHALPALYAVLIKKSSKLVFTPHYHGTSLSKARKIFLIPYKLLWSRFFYKVDKIICVSEAERQKLYRDFNIPDAKSTVIPNGINVGAIEKAKPFIIIGKLLLYVGRIEKYKNIDYPVKTMACLPNEWKFYIVGDGPYKNSLNHLIQRLNLSDRVKILPGLSDEEVYRWYKTCSLFVSLSSMESFGITVLEALAAGKRALVSAIPAFQGLANTFSEIHTVNMSSINTLELAQMISQMDCSNSQPDNINAFSWDVIAERIKHIYSQVFGEEIQDEFSKDS